MTFPTSAHLKRILTYNKYIVLQETVNNNQVHVHKYKRLTHATIIVLETTYVYRNTF